MGRVEYSKQTNTFIIYGPEIVNDDNVLKLIKLSFHLEDQVIEVITYSQESNSEIAKGANH